MPTAIIYLCVRHWGCRGGKSLCGGRGSTRGDGWFSLFHHVDAGESMNKSICACPDDTANSEKTEAEATGDKPEEQKVREHLKALTHPRAAVLLLQGSFPPW